MFVYWVLFAMTFVVMFASYSTYGEYAYVENYRIHKTKYIYSLLFFALVVFVMAMRDEVLDTHAYVKYFENAPTKWNKVLPYLDNESTGKGFYLLQAAFKILVSESHYVWFAFLAAVCCICLFKVLYKYSVDMPLTVYLFIADSTFTWLLNGTRQFLAVCIIFACTDLLLKRKLIPYCIIVYLASRIHSSAIFVIPVALMISSDEFFSKKTFLFIILTIIGVYYSESVFETLGSVMDKDYTESLEEGTGSTVLRLLVAAVPSVMAFVGKEHLKAAPKFIRLAGNMSIVSTCFYFASTFTNGILIGRMPIYFSLYSLYLLPWLIKNMFSKRTGRIVWWCCVLLYGYYFYYQIMVAWRGLPYVSKILGIGV